MPALTTSIPHSSRSPSQNNQKRKRKKKHPKLKSEGKTIFVYRVHDLICRNPKAPTKYIDIQIYKMLELVNKFSKVTEYKTNKQKISYISIPYQ